MASPFYTQGTISIALGDDPRLVTGSGMAWLTAGVMQGDRIKQASTSLFALIAAVNEENELELAEDWPGDSDLVEAEYIIELCSPLRVDPLNVTERQHRLLRQVEILNEGIARIRVKHFGLTAPAGDEEDGDAVVVAASGATGPFAEKANRVLRKNGSSWDDLYSDVFAIGLEVYDTTANNAYYWSGAQWIPKADILDVREKLTANRTYYVRPDGNDTNTGLADSAGAAFLTIQKAFNTVFLTLDLSGFDVDIRLSDGSYGAGATAPFPQVGAGKITVKGNEANPENVIVTGNSASAFFAGNGAILYVQDLEARSTTSGYALQAEASAIIYFQNLRFGACVTGHIRANDEARVIATGNYKIVGGASSHINCAAGTVRVQGRNVDVEDNPTFSAFLIADVGGAALLNGTTFSGAAYGRKYLMTTNAAAYAHGVVLPGNIPGSAQEGAVYRGLESSRTMVLSNRTYYVATDGSDTYPGDLPSFPFLTVQAALDKVLSLDIAKGVTVTIKIADGTYSGSSGSHRPLTGQGSIAIEGNLDNPENVVLQGVSGGYPDATIVASGGFAVVVRGVTLENEYGHCLYARWGGVIEYENVRFGNAAKGHATVSFEGLIWAIGDYEIVGNAWAHFHVHAGTIRIQGPTATLTGTPDFSIAFAWNSQGGVLIVNASTFSGAATGKRFLVETNGVLQDGASNLSLLPGDEDGIVRTGGDYQDTLHSTREILHADRSYYVSTSGSDTNDGLTVVAPFATIEKAIAVVFGTLDLGGFNVDILLADGTYSEGVAITAAQVGAGTVSIKGNLANPENVILAPASAFAVRVANGAALHVQDFTTDPVGNFEDLVAGSGGVISYQNLRIAGHWQQVRAQDGGRITCLGNYKVVSGGLAHWAVVGTGVLRCQSKTIEIEGSPAFAQAFLIGQICGAAIVNGNTFSGAATGRRYSLETNAVAHTGAATLPGDDSGVTATGGQYI